MNLEFQEYQPRKIVNVHRHVDSWFWDKYSAHPYIGCRSGCEFCYLRGGHYLGKRPAETFDTLIQIKTNAAELLRKELIKLPVEVIACGDWQEPAETRYQVSRQMLEVVYDLGFPLLVIERSPLVSRDLDLLADINRKAWVGVVFSLSNLDEGLKRAFEPRSPGIRRRLAAMAQIAQNGILVGGGLMPVLPLVGDDDHHLEEAVRAVKDHGGQFILAGGLSMAGMQAERTIQAASQVSLELADSWRKMYNWLPEKGPEYSPSQAYSARLGRRVKEICLKYGLPDRMPRPVFPGKAGSNKRISEMLFLKTYKLEIGGASQPRIWAYRQAAWSVDEMEANIQDIYATRGESGIRELPAIGNQIAAEICQWIRELRLVQQ